MAESTLQAVNVAMRGGGLLFGRHQGCQGRDRRSNAVGP